MARGSRGAFGGQRDQQRCPIWLGFCALFLLGLADLRRPLTCATSTWWCCSRSRCRSGSSTAGTSSRACRSPIRRWLYLLGRMVWSGWRGRLGTGAVPVWPVWLLAAATVFARRLPASASTCAPRTSSTSATRASIGANRIVNGQSPYGHMPVEGEPEGVRPGATCDGEIRDRIQTNGRCESANPQRRHVRARRLRGVHPGVPRSSAGAASGTTCPRRTATAIAFDLLCAARASRSSGCASAGMRLAVTLAVRLGRVPVHAVRLELEHERRAAAAVPDLGLLAASRRRSRAARSRARRAGRSSARCCVAPLWASYPDAPAAPRSCVFAAGFVARDAGRVLDPAARAEPGSRGARLLGPHARLADRPRVAVLDLGLAAVPRAGCPTCTSSSGCSRRCCSWRRARRATSSRGARRRCSSPR